MIDAVPNQPPTADAGGPYDVQEGWTLALGAAGFDPEGGPLAFAWDLDGDGAFETPGQNPNLQVEDGPSIRTVKVKVTDDGGATAVAVANVTVDNVAPSALFHAPSQAAGAFQLSLSDPFDPSLPDTAAGFTYAFDCGSGYGAYGDAAAVSCPAGSAALNVGGRVRDKDGGVSEYRATVSAESVQSTPTFNGLCALTRTLSHKPRVARSLCRTLAKAARAKSANERRRQLRTYRAEVRAHTGWKRSKAFRPPDGARLQALARQLES